MCPQEGEKPVQSPEAIDDEPIHIDLPPSAAHSVISVPRDNKSNRRAAVLVSVKPIRSGPRTSAEYLGNCHREYSGE